MSLPIFEALNESFLHAVHEEQDFPDDPGEVESE